MNDMFVLKPQGPDSQMFPSESTFRSGSPSVLCASTTAAGVNRALQAEKLGIGWTVTGFPIEPGGVTGGSGNSETATTPAKSAGEMAASPLKGQTTALYAPGSRLALVKGLPGGA